MKFTNLKFIEFIPDFLNFIVIFFFIYYFVFRFKIQINFFFYLIFLLILTFIINNAVHWSFFPDQTKYSYLIDSFRNFRLIEFQDKSLSFSVRMSSILMSIIPLPFITTTFSVALINRAIISILIIYFLKNRSCSIFLIYILLFLPSIVIYSSFALREILVLCIALIYFYFFISKKRFWISLFFITILLLIKETIAVIYIVISFFYYIFFVSHLKKIIKLFFTILFSTLVLIFNKVILLNILNMRQGFDSELLNYTSIYTDVTLYPELNSFVPFLKMLLYGLINFLLSPLSTSLTLGKILLFIENLFLYILIIFYLKNLFKINQFKVYFWIVVLLLLSIFIGIIFQNAGTMWRYKLQFLITILFAIDFSKNRKVF